MRYVSFFLTESDTSNRNPEPIFTPRKMPRKFFAAEMVPGAAGVPASRGTVSNRPLLLLQWSRGSARHFQFATVQPHSRSIPAEAEGPGMRPHRRRSIRRLRRPLWRRRPSSPQAPFGVPPRSTSSSTDNKSRLPLHSFFFSLVLLSTSQST